MKKIPEDLGFFMRQARKMRNRYFRENLTLKDVLEEHSCIIGCCGKRMFSRRLHLESDLSDIFWDYITKTYKIGNSSDKALKYIITPNIVPYLPLEKIIEEEIKIPVFSYFGDDDWMDSLGARNLTKKENLPFSMKIIKNSGHQITMDNPNELVKEILIDLRKNVIK